MGETDTKLIESGQAALYLFGQRSDSRRCRSSFTEETRKDKELDLALKDFASYRFQLEIRESAYKQPLLQLQVYQKEAQELSSQLKKSDADRDKYSKKCEAARSRIADLESESKDLLRQLLERREAQGDFQFAVDWEGTHKELKVPTAEVRSELNVLGLSGRMGTAIGVGKRYTEELLKKKSKLKEAIHLSNPAMNESEKDRSNLVLVKDDDLQVVTVAAMQIQEQLEEKSKQLAAVKYSENQMRNQLKEMNELTEQSHLVDSLRFELKQVREVVECMGKDLDRSREELQSVKEERDGLHHQLELAMSEMQKTKDEINEIQERENDLQIEIAMLRSELHRGRAKTAAAEAAEARIKSVKSVMYLAVQELAIEVEETRRENQNLKAAAGRGIADSSDFCSGITISMEEYESLVQKAEKADKLADPPSPDALHMLRYGKENELQELKKEFEVAKIEKEDFRRAAEQAEAAKAAIENQLRKWREQQQKRRAALAAFREESSGDKHPPIYDSKPATYQPLGKILNVKF